MFINLKELREKAYKILSSYKWLSAVRNGDREVQINDNGFYCHSRNRFDYEFITNDIEEAVNYLYPEI